MQDNIFIGEMKIDVNKRIRTGYTADFIPSADTERKETINILIAEGGEGLYNYVEWLGLEKDPNLVVLSSVHHYFYDDTDFKEVKTIINLKQLNQIKNVEVLLNSIYQIIPPKSNFVGSFLESKKSSRVTTERNNSSPEDKKFKINPFENDIISKIPFLNMVYSLLDSKTNKHLTRRNVTNLLEQHGFKVLDMTELNGLTYFLAQKIQVVTE